MTGWTNKEAQGLPVETVFKIINEDTRAVVDNPAVRALREGIVFGLGNHTILVNREGKEIAIDDSGAPIKIRKSSRGAILVFRDISERRQGERARALLAGIVDSSEDAIVSKALERALLLRGMEPPNECLVTQQQKQRVSRLRSLSRKIGFMKRLKS